MMTGRTFFLFLAVFLSLSFIPVAAGAATLYVGDSQTFASIQAAVNAAQPGDTIEVVPGLYDERIVINKAITLRGATAGVSKKGYVVPDSYVYDHVSESVIQPSTLANEPVVDITSGGVTFDGFIVAVTVAKTYPTYANTYLIRMVAAGNLNDVTIQNNVLGPVTNLTHQDGNAGRMVIAISKWSKSPITRTDNTVYNLQIRNNKIFDAKGDGCGILMIGENNWVAKGWTSLESQFKGAVIDNNEITGNHRSGIDFSGGVQGGAADEDHIRITNNIISNNGWNSTVDKDNIKWGNGIVFIRMTNQLNEPDPWGSRFIDIENNEFSGNEKNAIYVGPINRDITITGNIIQDNGRGTGGYNDTWDGIRVDLDETYQIEELARHPEQGVYNGQKIYDYITDIIVGENAISGNGGYGLNIIGTPLQGPVDARNNWWGEGSGPENALSNPAGTGDAISINARYVPWVLGNLATPVSPAGGAGPILVVGSGNFSTIQAAINAASAGDAIKVMPGPYNERIVINKSVTLLGATNGISKKDYPVPDGYAYDETTESIIRPGWDEDNEVVDITAGNVVIDGFIVANTVADYYAGYSLTHLIGLSNRYADYNDVIIRNNVLGPNTNAVSQNGKKGRAAIAVYGQWPNTVYNFTISQNRIFNAEGDGCGIMLLGAYNGTTQGTVGKYRGALIDNNTISGNHRSGIEFAGGVQGIADTAGHFRITSNNITSNGWFSTADKDNLKYGNGVVLIRTGSDAKSSYNPLAWGSRYVDIENNYITGNEKNGIYIGPVNRDITITGNTISDNGAGTDGFTAWDGVRVDLDEAYHLPAVMNYNELARIVLRDNDISGNGDFGVRVIQTPVSGPVDARNNWWGSAGGPQETTENPAGTANNVSENVLFSPWYTSPVKTPAGLPKPVAAFTADPIEDIIGATFSFDASESESQSDTGIQTYQWDYGDGNSSMPSASPFSSWAYSSARVHTVTLTVVDFNGMNNQTTQQVTVIAKKEAIPLTFTGTTTEIGTSGTQDIIVDIDNSPGVVVNTTTNLTITNPGAGWEKMIVVGNTSGGGGAPVKVQNITQVILKSTPVVTTLNNSAGGVGSVTTGLELSLTNFTSAPLEIAVTQGANATVTNAFQLAAGAGNQVDAVAYTMTVKGTSLINSNLSAPVRLNMSVSEAWVTANGGIGAIKAIRYSDDGNTREVLVTNYLFSAGTPVMCYFEVISPNGCSIFGIAAVSAVPQSPSPPSSAASASSSSGGGDSGSPATWQKSVEQQPVEQKPAQLAPLETPEVTPAPTAISVSREWGLHFLDTQPYGISGFGQILDSFSKNTSDPVVLVNGIITFIVKNIVVIAIISIISLASAVTIIWYYDRRNYWPP